MRSLADGPDDVNAEDLVGLLVGDDLDEAVGLVDRHGASERGERELADLNFDALLLGLRFGETDRGDLGIGEDGAAGWRPSPSRPCDPR